MIWKSLKNKEMKKIRSNKNIWYNWLISYIPEPIRKGVDRFKDEIVSIFKINTHKQTVYGRGKKRSKPKTQYKTNNIRNLFIIKKKKNKLNIE